MVDIPGMKNGGWRGRLAAAVEHSGKSMRQISLRTGRGPGYLHSVLKAGKDPTVDYLVAICEEVGVSLSHVMYGFDISAEAEAFLRELQAANPVEREALLTLLKRDRAEIAPPPPQRLLGSSGE